LSAKELTGGQTQRLNVHRIRRVNCHPDESDEDSAPERSSHTEDWLHGNGDLDNPNDSENDRGADVESDIEQYNIIEDPDSPEQWGVSSAPNVPGLIRPTRKSKRPVERVLMTVNAIEMRRNKGVKKKQDIMPQSFTSFIMYLELEF